MSQRRARLCATEVPIALTGVDHGPALTSSSRWGFFIARRKWPLESFESNPGLSMNHGGARPGAGRPRKIEKYASAIQLAENKIRDNLPTIVDRMLELVEGVTVQETNSHGEERIYTRPPDREAGKYLMDRIMGKPTQPLSNDSEDGGAIFSFQFNSRRDADASE